MSTSKVKCIQCGQYHAWGAIEVVCKFPDAYFDIPEEERGVRVKTNSELCIIDDEHYYVRGVLPVPTHVKTKPFYHWGVWVRIDVETYRIIYNNWDVEDQSHIKGLKGKLANENTFYGNTINKTIRIQPISNKARPHFYFTHDRRLKEIQNTKMTSREMMRIFHYYFVDV